MKHTVTALLLLVLVLSFSGCRSRTDKSAGTVILSVSSFNQLPIQISAKNGPFQIPTLQLTSVAKDPTGTTSTLQTIELRSYEVTFTRRDTGTRVPPPLVASLFGNITVGGTTTENNLPFMMSDQILNPPLLDLAQKGVDSETGTAVVVLDVHMRFFGRTLAGDDIVSQTASFTIDVTP
ncbi:MAG TPA: hypothetical protein VH988_02825 [Thermoanaerobaculia bacterium]|jgi:hypothetical protein|nr:hypothetical protein [Thermoanaerobaculia bacterium]